MVIDAETDRLFDKDSEFLFLHRGHRGQWHGVRQLKQLLPDIRTIFVRIIRQLRLICLPARLFNRKVCARLILRA
jgi:hypothetical protein